MSEAKLIAILTIGTDGDVLPYIELAKALKMSVDGKLQVAVVTHESFRKRIEDAGLVFGDIGPDPLDQRVNTVEGQALLNASFIDKPRLTVSFMQPLIAAWGSGALGVCRQLQPDYLILATLPVWCCHFITEALSVPFCTSHLAPMAPTAAHAPPEGFGTGQVWFEWAAAAKWSASMSLGWNLIYSEPVNAERSEAGLEKQADHHLWDIFQSTAPVLLGYSRHLAPKPWDLGDNVHVTGQWFDPDYTTEGDIPDDVARFLSDHKSQPTVFVTFGSQLKLVLPTEQRLTEALQTMATAIAAAGARALIAIKGVDSKEAISALAQFPHVMLADGWLPHAQIMTRCDAVLCHGGSGTVHTAVRSGTPVVVVPAQVSSDQLWWAGCVARAGVGPAVPPYTDISGLKTGGGLTRALQEVLSPRIKERAQQLAKQMADEPGVAAAARAILAHLRVTENLSQTWSSFIHPETPSTQ